MNTLHKRFSRFMRSRARESRRGSVLVLILGALALISVVTIVYVTIGQGDRRTAAATVRKDNVENVAERIADYTARVIGDAVLATHVDGTEGGEPVLVRNAFDFPFTDPYRLSVVNNAAQRELRRFRPTGSYAERWPEGGGQDRRTPASPYLAATRPTWFKLNGVTLAQLEERFRHERDWYHITNIAPDGRFVNLWNLRNNFDAPSFDPNNLQTPGPGHMNHELVLLDEDGNPTNQLPFGGQASANIPAHWTLFQQRAFRLARDPQDWYPAQGANYAARRPGHEWYPPSQWADADGDGFFDSRWFELVDGADPDNILSLLPLDRRYRYFAAVRIVDLSALVNVNTATDFRTPPMADREYQQGGTPVFQNIVPPERKPKLPIGISPADVDLRRLLVMHDQFWEGPQTGPWAYGLMWQNGNPGPLEPRRPYWDTYHYGNLLGQTGVYQIGELAYESLGWWLRPQIVQPHPYMSADERAFYYEQFGRRTSARYSGAPHSHLDLWRPEWRDRFTRGGADAFLTFSAGNALPPDVGLMRRFGIDDLAELLTFRTVNSPTSSRLEEVMGGRGVQRRISPLRDNLSTFQDRDALSPEESLARAYFDVRQHLTPLSGARPLRSNIIAQQQRGTLRPESNVVQLITIPPHPNVHSNSGATVQGSFRLIFNDQVTANIPWNANAGAVRDALAELPGIGANDIRVEKRSPLIAGADANLFPQSWLVEFIGNFEGRDVPQLEVDRFGLAYAPALTPLPPDPVPPVHVTKIFDAPDLQVDAEAVLAAAADHDYIAPLFEAYASALLPHAWRPNSWAINRRTLHYGYSEAFNGPRRTPEIGLRMAAHMAVNMAAAFSADSRHRGYTLLIEGSPGFRNQLMQDGMRELFPFWEHEEAGALDFDRGETPPVNLSPNQTNLSARAVNIYGIQPQPVITMVAAFHIYTDSQKDKQVAEPPLVQGEPVEIGEADGDYLGQFLAIQLTNPFDVEINLTGGAHPVGRYSEYYIEFGDNLYRLEHDGPDGVVPAVLGPGESRVAVALSHPIGELVTMWQAANAGAGTVTAEGVREVIDHQMSVVQVNGTTSRSPIIMRRFNPDGTVDTGPVNGTGNFFTRALSQLEARDFDAVHLWRSVHPDPRATPTAPAMMTPEAYRQAHMLVDRMRIPFCNPNTPSPRRSWLARHFERAVEIVGTNESQDDNTGYTVMFWSSVSRSNRIDSGGTATLPRGAMPPYMLEVKRGWEDGGQPQPYSLNHREEDRFGSPCQAPDLRREDFGDTANDAARTFWAFFERIRGSAQPVVNDLRRHPEHTLSSSRPIGQNLENREFTELLIEILANNERFVREMRQPNAPNEPADLLQSLRVADMLLPLAVGPSNDPIAYFSAPPDVPPHQGWITLTESLALALHYSNPPAPAGPNDPFGIWHDLGHADAQGGGANPRGAVDRGHLVLDRFVPFDDVNNSGQFNPASDERRFPGIPLALNVLNTFRVGGPDFGEVPDTVRSAGRPLGGPLVQKVHGLVNINTASRSVLRLIPFFSPSFEPGIQPNSTLWEEWLQQTHVPTGHTMPMFATDIAVAVAAYRDKLRYFDRGDIDGGLPRENAFDNHMNAANPVWDPAAPNFNIGRVGTTGLWGLREAPGIASRAEILAMVSADSARLPDENQMNYLARDEGPGGVPAPSGIPGTASVLYRNPTVGPGQPTHLPNSIPNSYDENFIIANAALGSVSVRSDVFAVWILLHGYQRSDVEGLGEDDPLVPSVAKRYLMVVDRSNVTRLGDRPQILLLKEVPAN